MISGDINDKITKNTMILDIIVLNQHIDYH